MEGTKHNETPRTARKAWDEPRIVLERLLLVSAQDLGPEGSPFDGAPQGFLGPLGTSGTTIPNNCR